MVGPDDEPTLGLDESEIARLDVRLPYERVGPYRLLSSLGAGGMGEVFLAERVDGGFRQEVALKLVPFALTDSERAARLRRERQILAQLEHPNIARLLDGGLAPDGTPFIAMEYVRGQTLDDWLDARRPDLEQRLDRFLELCAAVAYAHQRLVIHRDIKPANVLIDDSGKARLLDFGIAKLLAPDSADPTLTVAGLSPMTASYATPEQVLGQPITTATDVYQLGLVLYWLLTAKQAQPLSRTTRASEVESIVCAKDPQPPSRCAVGELGVRLSGRHAEDLDTIVLKALRKEPEQRYASADALADDLRRMRARQPILARPMTTAYRLRRFVERHTLASALAVLALLALVGFGLHERHLRAEAELARFAAEQSLDDRNRALARAESVQGFLVDMFSGAQASGKGHDLRVVDVLDSAEAKIGERIGSDPDAAVALVGALGRVRQSLGQYREAAALVDAHLATLESALGEDDERVLDLLNTRAAAADYLADYPLKFTLNERRFERLRRSRGERDAATLAALFDVGASRYFLDRADPRAWEEMSTASRAIADVLGPGDPRALEVARYEVQFLYLDRRFEEAQRRGRVVHRLAEAALGPTHRSTLHVLNMVAMSFDGLGRWQEALDLQKRIDALTIEQSGPVSAALSNARNRRGLLHAALGDLDAAIATFESAVEVGSQALGPNGTNVVMARFNLATVLNLAGQYERAAELAASVLVERQRIYGEHSTMFVMTLLQDAVLRARAGDFPGARKALDRAGQILDGLDATSLHASEWLPDQLAAQRALLRAWEHGPQVLDEAFLEPMRRLQEVPGPHTGSMFHVLLIDLRELRQRYGRLPEAVEVFERTIYPEASQTPP